MRPFLEEFYERRRDVRRYLAVLVRSEQLIASGGVKRHERELRMFRAGALLVLYNAVEASARSGIQAIYDEIAETQTPFEELRETLRGRILKDFKNNASIEKHQGMRKVACEMITASFDPRKLFSGNVDAKEIRDQSNEFGFASTSSHVKTRHGADLLTIKEKRNDLAHGVLSFSEVGRDYTVDDIRKIGRYSLSYLEAVLLNIDRYLTAKDYLIPLAA
jgi:hypothetical protein